MMINTVAALKRNKRVLVEVMAISDEDIAANSIVISKLSKGLMVHVEYYCAFHDIEKEGRITEISIPFKYIKLNGEKIIFEDIYRIRITDNG